MAKTMKTIPAGNIDEYIAGFDRTRAATPELSYVITHVDTTPNLSNLDRWYERDQGRQYGAFVLFKVRLRPTP